MGEETIQYCRSYAFEAERKMGEMLKVTERHEGGRPLKTSTKVEPVSPTLSELGITKTGGAGGTFSVGQLAYRKHSHRAIDDKTHSNP